MCFLDLVEKCSMYFCMWFAAQNMWHKIKQLVLLSVGGEAGECEWNFLPLSLLWESSKFKIQGWSVRKSSQWPLSDVTSAEKCHSSALPSQKKKNRITKIILFKQNKAVHPHLSRTLPLEVAVGQNIFFSRHFFLFVVIWHRQLAIAKSSNTKTLARTCPITAKAVNQLFT